MNYFKTVGGALILIGVIGLELLFAAGIWYMIAIGMTPALGDVWSIVLACIAAPVIGILAIVLFVYGPRLKQIILEWEAENGEIWDEDAQVYHNKTSYTRIVDVMKWIVFLADTAGILYRVSLESVSLGGKLLLIAVFELLAVSPFFVGTLVHIVAHRPIAAIRRDAQYIRDVPQAQAHPGNGAARRQCPCCPDRAPKIGDSAGIPGQPAGSEPESERKPESVARPEPEGPEPEEKASTQSSDSEAFSSESGSTSRKVRRYSGKGRIHTEEEIDQILDWYILTGQLPMNVSERQRYSYRHHIRLPERRKLLEKQKRQNGRAKAQPDGHAANVVSLEQKRSQRRGSSS